MVFSVRLCEEVGQPMASVVSFGDAMNDMEMIMAAGEEWLVVGSRLCTLG